jgi:hypothetical protein
LRAVYDKGIGSDEIDIRTRKRAQLRHAGTGLQENLEDGVILLVRSSPPKQPGVLVNA